MKKNTSLTVLLTLFLIVTFSCTKKQSKIVFINSYHEGYGSSDDITAGIEETLASDQYVIEKFYMNSKQHNTPEYLEGVSAEFVEKINTIQPDVIIASDDNAAKYVIAEHYKNGPYPTVFCGVNWSCEQYGFPTEYVTGMLEVLPLDKAFTILKEYYPKAKKLWIISENTSSSRKNKKLLEPLYQQYGFETTYAFVDDYSDWRRFFKQANDKADLIYFETNGGIKYWNNEGAKEYIQEIIKTPIFTCDDFIMDYAVFGFTKVAKEQGIWAAQTAIEIINGKKVSKVPVTKNKQSKSFLNTTLAEKINFKIDDKESTATLFVKVE